MHSSWNQWGGSVAPPVPSYGTTYPPAAVPPAGPYAPFQVNPTPPVTTPAVATPYQTPLYGQPQQPPPQPPQTQQQWQQWEQWQQQYAAWHQQYGDKYQGPLPTGMLPPGMPTMPSTYPSIPPLPPGAPIAQPPPPDSVPPPNTDKNDTDPGKRPPQDGGKEETKKQKTGKGKAETVEDLIEQEKTFDEQFKSWETSFMKWKEQNANHPDKTQYKEFETKWESWREQLIQKREQLRKKRENKEAEVAAAAAAAKEVALATNTNAAGYSTATGTAVVTQSNPYLPSNMMYPMAGMYPTQDMSQMAAQAQTYMPNYPMYNMPPPASMPAMAMMSQMSGHDQQNKLDASKTNQSLEFLTPSSATNAKSIPGLDLVGSDKPAAAPAVSSIPQSSSLFSYNQDVTKPLHTSDDKPFNFPTPQQPNNFNYPDQSRNQYSSFQLSRPPPSLPQGQYQQNFAFDQKNDQNNFSGDRQRFDDKFDNRPGANLQTDNYRSPADSRNDTSLDKGSKFGTSTYTPNFNSEKYAKYYEDEYDDSRFRDPEPPESPQRSNSKFNNYGRNERDNFSNFRSNNFGNTRGGFNSSKFDDFNRDFNDTTNNRREMGRGRGRQPFGDRNKPDGANSFNNRYQGFGRGQAGDNALRPNFNSWQNNDFKGPPKRFDNAENDKSDPGKPVSLLDLPMMKPPDAFDKNPFGDKGSGPFGGDKGPDGGIPRSDAFKLGDTSNSRLGSNIPHPLKGPPFGDADNSSRLGSKNSNSQLDIANGRQAPDSNKFPPQGSFQPSKPQPQNATAPKNDGPAGGDQASAAKEVDVDLIPSLVFEYDHVKKTSAESLPSAFDAVYIFDYGHGKKKTIDNKDFIESLASEVKISDKATWGSESWNGDKKLGSKLDEKLDSAEPLPQRIKPSTDLTKELVAILNKSEATSENKPKEVRSENVTEKKVASAPWLRDTVKDIPVKFDEPAVTTAPATDVTTTTTTATSTTPATKPITTENTLLPANSKLIDDLLLPPGRHSRPIKLVIIMRGPPGSGKTYTAKLIKDKEVEMSGNPPRILSLDDYFIVDDEVEETDPKTGKKTTKKEVYEYEAALEPAYQDSLVKSFKKTVTDGFFPFIILDCVNDKLKKYEEMYTFALSKGFQVFVCDMDADLSTCTKRNIHNRTEDEIKQIIDGWEKTPPYYDTLDIRSLLQSAAITEVDMVDVEEEPAKEEEKSPEEVEIIEKPNDENKEPAAETEEPEKAAEEESDKPEKEEFSSYMDILCTSKWDSENTEEKLDRLDGVSKKRTSTTFKEWLQLPEDETDLSWYAANDKTTEANAANVPRKKRVRWADLEERVAQQKMRAIGFVVGQTDWTRMMDPSFGGSKLTQTKYIYK